MTYAIDAAPQGTPEWYAVRAGRATGSKAECITAKGRTAGTEAVTRRNYRVQLVTERLTGKSQEEDGFQSKDMTWGKEQEPFARMAYEERTGAIVEEAGFALLPNVAAGCSVDGFIDGRRGILELKCPKSAIHIGYLQHNRLPPEYVPQARHNVWVTGAEYIDFVSFDPRLPGKLQLLVVRIERVELAIPEYEAEVLRFLEEVAALESNLRLRAA